MSRVASGVVILVAFLLLALNVRLLSRVSSLEEKLDGLPKGSLPGSRPAATRSSEESASGPAREVPREESRSVLPQAPKSGAVAEPSVEAAPSLVLPSWTFTVPDRSTRPAASPELPDVTDVQRRTIAELHEARRKEQLQIEGELAVRKRELFRRYDALVRACLGPEQQQRYDEAQRAAAPKPDGPVTASARNYIAQDPAPYDLEVEWRGEWWPARTVGNQGDLTLIHYVGHGTEWHEWVPPERVRVHRP